MVYQTDTFLICDMLVSCFSEYSTYKNIKKKGCCLAEVISNKEQAQKKKNLF